MKNLIGRTLSQYQIISKIGRGGMGAVYKAWHQALERYIAIKVPASHLVWVVPPRYGHNLQTERLTITLISRSRIINQIASVLGYAHAGGKEMVQPALTPAGQWASLSCLMPPMEGATSVNSGWATRAYYPLFPHSLHPPSQLSSLSRLPAT